MALIPAKKTLGLKPADPLGARFCEYFNHPWNFIFAPVPAAGEKTQWKTENRYPLQPRNLWAIYKDPKAIVGLRFGRETRYALIDIDRGSDYHPDNNPERFQLVLIAAEKIGLCRHMIVQSSESGGLHVYFFLSEPVPTFGLACALKFALLDEGLQLHAGQLEIFPNVKPYSKAKPTDYNGHRLPLQAGSWLLDADKAPVTQDISQFLDWADQDATQQDMEALEDAIAAATGRQKLVYIPGKTNKAELWKQHLENRITEGWTDSDQTNELLKDFVCYGIVFLGLSGEALIDYVVKTATTAPGYEHYCSHKHEIRQRAADRATSTERNQFYTPYRSNPPRKATYRETYSDVPNPTAANNLVPFHNLINEQRSSMAHERIQNALAHLKATKSLPLAATVRAKAIVATIKAHRGVTVSNKTLYKKNYLPLWHPNFDDKGCGINELEQDSGTSSLSSLTDEATSAFLIETPEAAPEGDLPENSTPPPYMKVGGDLLSAPDAPQGHLGAANSNLKQGGFGGDFAAVSDVLEPLGVASEVAATPLTDLEDKAPEVAVPTPELTTEPSVEPIDELRTEPPADLWCLTRIRLEARSKALKAVKQQACAFKRLFSYEERVLRETLAKMRIFWESGERVLMDEVTAWVETTAGLLMTDSGPALVSEVQFPPPSFPASFPPTTVSEPTPIDNETDQSEKEISDELAAKILAKMAAMESVWLNADYESDQVSSDNEADPKDNPSPNDFTPPTEVYIAEAEPDYSVDAGAASELQKEPDALPLNDSWSEQYSLDATRDENVWEEIWEKVEEEESDLYWSYYDLDDLDLTTTPTSDESTIVEKEPSPAWRLLSASEQAGIESLNPQVSFEEWKEVERAVLTTTGEEVIILDFFENNGILIAIIEYLSDGSQGTSDLDFLRPSPQ